jgi:hypothetical protein
MRRISARISQSIRAAHDNDAERAARAGLAILDAIAKLNQQPGHAQLSTRIGIDSGLVVIGQGAGSAADQRIRKRALPNSTNFLNTPSIAQLWRIELHRLIGGDSTDSATVNRL